MPRQGGFGLKAKISIDSTLTSIVYLVDAEWPKFKKFIAEITGHDSPDGYYESIDTGKRRIEPFPVTLAWDDTQATHAAILSAFNGTTPVGFSIADPTDQETISFSVHVEEIERLSPQEEGYQAKVLFHPTGSSTSS